MLDILYTLFSTIIHGIQNVLNIILSIPVYVNYLTVTISSLPVFITAPLLMAITAAVIIHIKRLVF